MSSDPAMTPFVPSRDLPMMAFVVSKEQWDRALNAIDQARKTLTQEQVFDVLYEIGYGDAIDLSISNPFAKLTELQLVATAAALLTVAKSGGKQEFINRS